MKAIKEELYDWKKEAESMHSLGMIVPSWLYERIHRLEKMVRQEKKKLDKKEKNNESE